MKENAKMMQSSIKRNAGTEPLEFEQPAQARPQTRELIQLATILGNGEGGAEFEDSEGSNGVA